MLPENDTISRRQLTALAFAALLSPMVRRMPEAAALRAGAAAWAAPLAALPVLAGLVFLMRYFFNKSAEGEGLGELLLRSGGGVVGRAALSLYALWLVFYAGFLLRSGAERLVTTVYPNSGTAVFVLITAAVCLFAALGRVCALVRSAAVVRPVLLAAFLIVLAFALPAVKGANLPPLSRLDAVPVLYAALPVCNVCGAAVYLCFLRKNVRRGGQGGSVFLWLGILTAIVCVLCLTAVGLYGAELTAKTPHPFFTIARNVVIFGTLERLEAVVITSWVFADFVLISALLYISAHAVRLVFSMAPPSGLRVSLFSMGEGRWVIWLCAAAAAAVGLVIAPDAPALAWFSHTLIPGLNTVFAFVIPGLLLAVGKLRKVI